MSGHERSGVDEAEGRWTHIDIGEIGFDRRGFGGGEEEPLRVYLWRRIPSPLPPGATKGDYDLTVVVDWMGEAFALDPDDADRLAEELPALLRAAANRSRRG